MLLPVAVAQFTTSFAGLNMNVAINNIGKDLDTTVHGAQTAISRGPGPSARSAGWAGSGPRRDR
jgi:hypothetical protein